MVRMAVTMKLKMKPQMRTKTSMQMKDEEGDEYQRASDFNTIVMAVVMLTVAKAMMVPMQMT
eukprot:14492044-Alexandrium_andersonii.AAC.1